MKIYKIKVNGKTYKVELESVQEVLTEKDVAEAKPASPVASAKTAEAPKSVSNVEGGTSVVAPIQGLLKDYKVKVGDKVKKGDVLLIIEAMKLENEVCAPCDGEVAELCASKGNGVTAKQLLLKIK